MTLKSLDEIDKELDNIVTGSSLPVIFLDTSYIIDICDSARQIVRSNKSKSPLYSLYADHHLMHMAGRYQTLVTPKTALEILDHASCLRNGHRKEITNEVGPILDKLYSDYNRLEENVLPNIKYDHIAYSTYLLSKVSSKDNPKKQDEGFSEVDLEILTKSREFLKYFSKEGQTIDCVVILSSDSHLSNGVDMIRKYFPSEKLFCLSPRRKK